MSYDLSTELLDAVQKASDVDKLATDIAEAVAGKEGKEAEEAAGSVFSGFGKAWMETALELGEKHSDQTYEVLKQAAEKTSMLRFPHVAQRFVEIAHLAIQPFREMDIVENNSSRLVYRIGECAIHGAVSTRCGEAVAKSMACRQACLTGLDTLFGKLDIKAGIDMTASMVPDGHCEFVAQAPAG